MPVTATEAPPEIDNLYLDMNGIIHNCTHANDPTLRLTETEMVLRIFMYLDKLIQITKPKKLVLLAIDGAQHASTWGVSCTLHQPPKAAVCKRHTHRVSCMQAATLCSRAARLGVLLWPSRARLSQLWQR